MCIRDSRDRILLTPENVKPRQINNLMTVVYGKDVPSHVMIKRWAAEFDRGIGSLEDEPWSGRSFKAVCEENCRTVENIVLQHCRVSAADSRHCAYKQRFSYDDCARTFVHDEVGAQWALCLIRT